MPENDGLSHPRRLRAAIEAPGMPVLPGAYDGVSARLIARAGFEAIYFSGGLSSSSFPGCRTSARAR